MTLNQKPNQDSKQIAGGIVVLGIIILIFVGLTRLCSSDDKKEPIKKYIPNKQDAVAYSHVCVSKYLKSPGSAKFPYQDDQSIDKLNDSTFIVVSYVDSQNEFGALIRNYYKCTVVVSDLDKFECFDMKFEEVK
jgi:hypothetical protein